jgi:hypothetical protein
MKKYTLFQPKNAKFNNALLTDKYEYERITTIEAIDSEDAFVNFQNDFSKSYANLQVRSASVGDIIVDVKSNKHYFIGNIDKLEISEKVTNYLTPGSHFPTSLETKFAKDLYNKSFIELEVWERRHVYNTIDAALTSH